MGGTAVSLKISGNGDAEALHRAVWEMTSDFISQYTASDYNTRVREFIGEAICDSEEVGFWGFSDSSLCYGLKDYAGCCSRSMGVWLHWITLAWVSEWEKLERLASEYLFQLEGERRPLVSVIENANIRYLPLRGDLWKVGEEGLHGDDRFVPLSELDEEERTRYQQAREQCQCDMCRMLWPSDEFKASMLGFLASDDLSTVQTAAWYLERIARPSPDVLSALVEAGSKGYSGLVNAVSRIASVHDSWTSLWPLRDDRTGGARALAFVALAETANTDERRMILLDLFRSAVRGDDEAAEVAAELLGRVGRHEPKLAAELAAVLDRSGSESMRHNTVLGLVNLHLPRTPFAPEIMARIKREALRDTPAGKLAAWARDCFGETGVDS